MWFEIWKKKNCFEPWSTGTNFFSIQFLVIPKPKHQQIDKKQKKALVKINNNIYIYFSQCLLQEDQEDMENNYIFWTKGFKEDLGGVTLEGGKIEGAADSAPRLEHTHKETFDLSNSSEHNVSRADSSLEVMVPTPPHPTGLSGVVLLLVFLFLFRKVRLSREKGGRDGPANNNNSEQQPNVWSCECLSPAGMYRVTLKITSCCEAKLWELTPVDSAQACICTVQRPVYTVTSV